MITHRAVRQGDIPAICAFPQSEGELFFMFPGAKYPLTPDQLMRSIDSRFDSTVVVVDGEVSGFANFHVCERGGTCSIGNVVVAPHARSRGVGRFLIELMVRTALSSHSAKEVCISCFNGNAAGLLLYAKLGFVPYEIEPRVDRRGARVALIHMKLSVEAMRRYASPRAADAAR